MMAACAAGDGGPAPARCERNSVNEGDGKQRQIAPDSVAFSPGPNLFIDDALIVKSRGLTRTTHQPEKMPKPVLGHDRPIFYMKVLYDADLGRYRMWYNAMGPIHGYAYSESRDGVEWTMPNLELIGGNYIDAPTGHWGFSLVDEGPGGPEPERRYKMVWFDQSHRNVAKRGMCVAFSADGLRFRPHENNPVIRQSVNDLPWNAPDYDNIISDILDVCVDPSRGEYLLGCKIEQSGFPGKAPHHAEGWRRCVGMSTSKDFVTWERPRTLVTPDPSNGLEEFYGFKPMVRGNLYIGFLRVLRDDLPATPGGPVEGIGWTELMTSRDGRNWTRHQEPFLDRDPRADRWDHAMAWYADAITVGDSEYIYFGGYRAGHKIRGQKGDREVGLAILRKNGFVSRDAGPEGGFLKTPAGVLPGHRMTVNAVVREEMRVRLVDTRGNAVPGFDWADVVPVRGDSVAHRIEWRHHRTLPEGQAVSIEFELRNAELYGFEFCVGDNPTSSS